MWLRRTKSKTRIHNSFSCSSFKDIQSLCAEDNNNVSINDNNNGNSNNQSSSICTKRVSNVFHRVRLANSVLAALLPVLPPDRNGNSGIAATLEHHHHHHHHHQQQQLKEDSILPVLPSDQNGNPTIATLDLQLKEDRTLPVLPSDQDGNSDVATLDQQVAVEDFVVPVLPSAQIGNSDVTPLHLPGAENRVVVYFTSLRVVRSTFEDCKYVRSVLHAFRVVMDERDLSMDSRFTGELQRIFAHENEKTRLALPRVFIDGRYIGGAEEVRQLHEAGELKKYVEGLPLAEPGTCQVCGGYGFILCEDCSGSRKIYSEKGGFRTCTACNHNGLVRCPSCSSAPL